MSAADNQVKRQVLRIHKVPFLDQIGNKTADSIRVDREQTSFFSSIEKNSTSSYDSEVQTVDRIGIQQSIQRGHTTLTSIVQTCIDTSNTFYNRNRSLQVSQQRSPRFNFFNITGTQFIKQQPILSFDAQKKLQFFKRTKPLSLDVRIRNPSQIQEIHSKQESEHATIDLNRSFLASGGRSPRLVQDRTERRKNFRISPQIHALTKICFKNEMLEKIQQNPSFDSQIHQGTLERIKTPFQETLLTKIQRHGDRRNEALQIQQQITLQQKLLSDQQKAKKIAEIRETMRKRILQKQADELFVRTAPARPKKEYRHMQRTQDKIKLLFLQDQELVKLNIFQEFNK